jgi:hypothetical protein
MYRLLLAIVLLLICSQSFSHDIRNRPNGNIISEKELANDANRAAAIALFGPSQNPDGSINAVAVGQKSLFGLNLRFPIGSTVTVCMWEQDRALRALIAKVSSEWMTKQPNLHLDFGDMSNPRQCSQSSAENIRIADDPSSPLSPYWSVYGSQSVQVPAGQPTMDLGFGGPAGQEASSALAGLRGYFHFVVLHEFGHAFGALHEHQFGKCAAFLNDAPQDAPRMIQAIFPSATTHELQQQALDNLRVLTQNELDSWGVVKLTSQEDADSVMRYDFPPGTYKVGAPDFCTSRSILEASKGDLEGLRKAYPQPGDPLPIGAAPALQVAESLVNNPSNSLSSAARTQTAKTVASLTSIIAASPPPQPSGLPGPGGPAPAAPSPPPRPLPAQVLNALNSLAEPISR